MLSGWRSGGVGFLGWVLCLFCWRGRVGELLEGGVWPGGDDLVSDALG